MCGHCGAIVPDGHDYCGRCGTRYDDDEDRGFQTLFYGALQAPGRAKLIMIAGDESLEGISFHITTSQSRIGRGQVEIALNDPHVSPLHATFFFRDNTLFLRDEGSHNVTFVRIRTPQPLEDGAVVRAGQQFFRFERLFHTESLEREDGTRYLASPLESSFRLLRLVAGGFEEEAYASPNNEVSVGREGCDLSYPDDPHMSKLHFKVTDEQSETYITDLGSKNGTFVRISSPIQLHDGDYIFIGRQLLRVELTG